MNNQNGKGDNLRPFLKKNYDDNFDLIDWGRDNNKLSPENWNVRLGFPVIDCDGFDRGSDFWFSGQITLGEFKQRAINSTCRFTTKFMRALELYKENDELIFCSECGQSYKWIYLDKFKFVNNDFVCNKAKCNFN